MAASAMGSEPGELSGVRNSAPTPTRDRRADSLDGVAEEDRLRAQFYGLLARLLAEPMSEETLALVRGLEGDDSDLGGAVATLAGLARKATRESAEEEFTALFYGMGAGGEVLPYASHYLTGFVYEKPLANLRGDLARFGVTAREGMSEPEDHIAFVCEVMHGLIVGAYGTPVELGRQRAFFRAHLEPWAGKCFAGIEQAKSAVLYMPVGTLGRLFMEIESEAFSLAPE